MRERGVLYMVWGDKADQVLERSRRSLALHHPELPVEVVRIEAKDLYEGFLEKAKMRGLSPFRETLFLDADTVVMGRLDFGFEKAAKHGIACCINECPWAKRNRNSLKGDIIEYNTGVIFFSDKAAAVFDAWEEFAPKLDSSIVFLNGDRTMTMPRNDQCSFAAAIERTDFVPFVLPLNWNYRPMYHEAFFGPIKVWHGYADPPEQYFKLNRYYEDPESIIQFHPLR